MGMGLVYGVCAQVGGWVIGCVDNKSFIRFGVVEYEDLFGLANNICLGLRPRQILFSRPNKSSYSTPPYGIND